MLNEFEQYLRELGEKINSGELKVEKIHLFLDLKSDLKKKVEFLEEISDGFRSKEKAIDLHEYDLFSPLSFFLKNSISSYIAPAYALNNYLDNLNDYNVNSLNKENLEKLDVIKLKFNIEIQHVFSSIKSLLDRLVAVMSYFYPGFSLSTTFGRINSSQKTSGLMGVVVRMKDQDELMNFIYEQYHSWIKMAVGPRDIITHYNDLGYREHWTIDGRLIPLHIEMKTFEEINYFESPPNDYSYKDIVNTVQEVYDFINTILISLLDKDFKLSKNHFSSFKSFEEYKKNMER